MNISRIYHGIASTLLLIFAAALVHSALGARLVEETFEVLQTRTGAYTNVTVTTKAENYIFIFHARGLTSIKLADLPMEIRQQLGYEAAESPKHQKANPIASVAAHEVTQVKQNLKPLEETWKQQWQPHRLAVKISSEVLCTLLAAALLFYLFFCYCCHLICLKAKSPTSFLEWVPGLQLIPLLRAAGMSAWWFLACFVPVLNILVHVIWSLNIVKARGKNIAWAVLLILPVTNLFAFLYLAFSSSSPLEIGPPKFQTRALQTA